MSLQWVTPRNDPRWASKSRDGYYAIAPIETGQVEHRAFHIEAVWATPKEIGRASTLLGAQLICEHHCERASAPA